MEKYLKKLQLTEFEILKEIDRICKKNNIQYSLYGGTLLGSIRHHGFIPWDDDIDIAMTRKNYIKFIKCCQKDLNSKYFLDCYETNKKYCNYYAKMKIKGTLFIENKNKDQYDEKSCIWVDIFPIDPTKNRMDSFHRFQYTIYKYVTTLITIKNGSNYYQNSKVKKQIYHAILKLVPMKFMTWILKIIISHYKEEEVEYLCSFASVYGVSKETYEKSKILPYKEAEFEGNKFSVFCGYDYILTRMYGEYMKLPPKEKRVNHKPYLIKFEDGEEIKFEK